MNHAAEAEASAPASPRLRRALVAAAFLRAVATAAMGVLLGLHLAYGGHDGEVIGWVVGSGLAGTAVAAGLVSLFGDRVGRRALLLSLTLLQVLGTLALLVVSSPLALALCAFLGMLNGMGRDRGPSLVLEQAVLPATGAAVDRTRVLARYTMAQDIGHALGSLVVAVPALSSAGAVVTAWGPWLTWTDASGGLLATALLGVAGVGIYLALGSALDLALPRRLGPKRRTSPETRRVLWRISALFGLDSLGGGFLTSALLSYFFFERFGASAAAIGGLFFFARLLNAGSHLVAAWLAGRIGLVKTMVFTHIPSSLLLLTVAIAPDFPTAAVLFLLREGLVEMDVPTRQSYVLGVVRPEERTLASGVTHLVRLAGWAIAPFFAGALMSADGSLHRPLVAGALLKIAYDLLLWRAFRGLPPPEERPTGGSPRGERAGSRVRDPAR